MKTSTTNHTARTLVLPPHPGYNAVVYTKNWKSGVIDPTKVTRTALQNASSVATLLLTSDALIAEAPKKEKKGGGGHGGMDDMY